MNNKTQNYMKNNNIFRSFLVLLAALLVCPLSGHAQTVRGDFNMDGTVGMDDLSSMINYLLLGTYGEPRPEDRDTITVNGYSFVMVRVEGGTYMREMAKPVTVETFSIGQTEVTLGLWTAVMGDDSDLPFWGRYTDAQPVNYSSCDECMEFITRLNELTGMSFRLPTWNEWLYAASGGKYTCAYTYAGSDDIDEVGWCHDNNTTGGTWDVGSKAPNELGLYDMTGNASEWGEISNFDYCYLMGGDIISVASECELNTSYKGKYTDTKVFYAGFRLAL